MAAVGRSGLRGARGGRIAVRLAVETPADGPGAIAALGECPSAGPLISLSPRETHDGSTDKVDLVWRGSPQPEEAGDVARALEPFDASDFVEAERRLKEVVSRYPQSAAGHFYLGVSELFLDRDTDGAIALENAERLAKDNAELAREAKWYVALAYRRMGQTASAASQLDALCRATSSRAAQACAGLRELSASSSIPR